MTVPHVAFAVHYLQAVVIKRLLLGIPRSCKELQHTYSRAPRKEEKDFMVDRLKMFEFGSYEEAVKRGGKAPTTTKWVEGWKADEEGGRFVRCRLVGRDFQKKGIEERGDLFAACRRWSLRN